VFEDLSIELGEAAAYQCACCGRQSETVHGYLYDESGATSVYFAGYTQGHPERRVNVALSIGGWGEGTTPSDREASALQVLADDHGRQYVFPPAETSPWYHEAFLGRMKSPDQLSREERARLQELAKAAVEKDPRVASYLARG
jgi:hypothetical protein